MGTTDIIPLHQNRIRGVTPFLKETFKDKTDYLTIEFSDGRTPCNFIVHVSKNHFADNDIVRIAQHFLHMQAECLTRSTFEWRLSDEEFDRLAARGAKSRIDATGKAPF